MGNPSSRPPAGWRRACVLALCLALAPALSPAADRPGPPPGSMALRKGWAIQSSCRVSASGEQLSTAGFDTTGWHPAEVPTTVVAALVDDRTFPDPYAGTNIRLLPGFLFPPGAKFPELPMPQDSPFGCSWWFRTEFRAAPAKDEGRWLRFDGINYRANIWLNGKKIADAQQVAGTFRQFEFDVAALLRDGANALAVEVFPPQVTDLAINWWDWNPTPPDKNMGLWNEVYLVSSGPVALRHPFATAQLSPTLDSAALTLEVEIRNATSGKVSGTLTAEVAGATLARALDLAPAESRTVVFAPDVYPRLRLARPRLWWPYSMGPQNLYSARFRFTVAGRVSDDARIRFGIRQVTSELTPQKNRLFTINGRKLLISGGGWTSDMLRLRESTGRLRDEFRYVRHMHLNTLRLEGKLETDSFYDLADEQGVLLMPGWMCCDIWQKWEQWPQENHAVAMESERTQLLRLRNHPSVFVWLYASDEPPPPPVEREYLQVVQQTHWPNPTLATASDRTTLTGFSGVKMSGPYEYVPPSYWFHPAATNLLYGGGFSLNTEASSGLAIPPLPSLTRMLTPQHLWPIDDAWNLRLPGDELNTLDRVNTAMSAIYGRASDLPDFLRKAHAMEYDSERAMFEAYRRNKYSSTGIIQWMLNNAWPSLYWHFYDWYLVPGAGYFAARSANEPLHIQYSYDERSIAVVSDLHEPSDGLTASAELYDLDLHRRFAQKVPVNLPADSVQRILPLPDPADTPVSFLRLRLTDRRGRTLSSNFYWLSSKPSTFDWNKTTFFYTPSPQYEDFTALARLPEVRLEWRAESAGLGDQAQVRVSVKNPGTQLAFQVWLRAFRRDDGSDIVPILWDDSYFSLLPGESRIVTATFDRRRSGGASPIIELGGWNVPSQSKPAVSPAGKH